MIMNDNSLTHLPRTQVVASHDPGLVDVRLQIQAVLNDAVADSAAPPQFHRENLWRRASLLCGFGEVMA